MIKISDTIRKVFDVVALRRQINTLTNERDTLKAIIQDELYKTFMDKLSEDLAAKRALKDNKRLRQQVKTLKDIIRNGE